jgi:hypothetical protein
MSLQVTAWIRSSIITAECSHHLLLARDRHGGDLFKAVLLGHELVHAIAETIPSSNVQILITYNT